jgi:hypothetical protein
MNATLVEENAVALTAPEEVEMYFCASEAAVATETPVAEAAADELLEVALRAQYPPLSLCAQRALFNGEMMNKTS